MSSTPEILMYSTTICSYCDRARALFARKQVPISEIKIDQDPAEFANMQKRSGGRRTVPQIFIGDRHVGGYNELAALEKAGELDPLLGRNV